MKLFWKFFVFFSEVDFIIKIYSFSRKLKKTYFLPCNNYCLWSTSLRKLECLWFFIKGRWFVEGSPPSSSHVHWIQLKHQNPRYYLQNKAANGVSGEVMWSINDQSICVFFFSLLDKLMGIYGVVCVWLWWESWLGVIIMHLKMYILFNGLC